MVLVNLNLSLNCFNEFNLNRGDSCWLTRFLRVKRQRGDAMSKKKLAVFVS